MCAMYLNILYTNDYGVPNHACDSGPTVNGHFNDSQDIINFIINSIIKLIMLAKNYMTMPMSANMVIQFNLS